MQRMAMQQCTLAGEVVFDGFGVHSGLPVSLHIEPAAVDTGFTITRIYEDGHTVGPVSIHFSRITRTTLCTTIDIGDSTDVETVEHVVSALSGLGIDNAHLVITNTECPILDGSALPYVQAILSVGIALQPKMRRFLKIKRAVTVRNDDAFAALEPYNGRMFDLEIDFDSPAIGRQRMIFNWSPKLYSERVAGARTFGFAHHRTALQQAGYALGSSLDNSILVENDQVINPHGLRYEDEFVRHKLLDAVGDLALGGLPIYGRFRSYKGGHKLNSLVLQSLFASEANYEIVAANELPLVFDALEDLPEELNVVSYLRAVR